MVQLSSPTPDMIPVQKGKSPDKAPGLKKDSEGFKSALIKQKERLESAESQNSERKKTAKASTAKSAESVSKTDDKRSFSTTHSAAAVLSNQKNRTSLLSLFVKGGLEEDLLTDKTNSLDSIGGDEKGLKLLNGNKKNKTSDKSSEPVSPGTEVHPAVLSAVQQKISEDESGDQGKTEPQSRRPFLSASENAEALKVSDEGGDTVKPAVILTQNDLKQDETGKKASFAPKSKKKASESDIKITVEDRRTRMALKPVPLLKEVESDGPSNKLTLELVPSDELPGMMPQGEQMDRTGNTFSIQTSEEQKGAALLDRQLQDKGTSELTKNIRFVMKDNKEGEIKLILKPEALGKVRINLNLQENNIVGKIIVENNSVRQVFMNNLADLTKALEDSGFSSASLEVSVGGGQTQQRQFHQEDKPVYFNDSSGNDFDGQIPVVYENGIGLGQINMVV